MWAGRAGQPRYPEKDTIYNIAFYYTKSHREKQEWDPILKLSNNQLMLKHLDIKRFMASIL